MFKAVNMSSLRSVTTSVTIQPKSDWRVTSTTQWHSRICHFSAPKFATIEETENSIVDKFST